ncbi:MAG: cytochrome d ubiquinol oxidase subunit II [Deltaproteobacteria bacterium]|nr:cytochrome d ubiquinol oxidase subunit II [Deltaproteobacteria bacterium]
MLPTIWFLLWGILWAVYFMLDGYDLGIGTLMPVLGKSETDRRLIFRAMGPFWDGNEVWLITAGGVTFAAFPTTYAVMFSGLYTALMLILFALILRGVSFAFRDEYDHPLWKKVWDGCLIVGSFLPALLFGVAFANIFRGLPLDSEGIFQGTLFSLLNPYGIAGGILFLLLFCQHGALWLAAKTTGELEERAAAMARRLWPWLFLMSVIFLLATQRITNLFANYLANPVLLVIPLLAVAALVMIRVYMRKGAWWRAWFASAAVIVLVTLFGVVGLYPNLLPSSIDPAYSLTAFNSSSSPLTLKIMLAVALTFVPVVIAYQTWVHFIFKDKISHEDLAREEGY